MKKKEDVSMQDDRTGMGTLPDTGENAQDAGTLDPGGDGAADGEQDGGDTGEDQEPEDIPEILTALYPILYHSHQYRVGDALPANDPEMVAAWTDAGTAAWVRPAGKGPKARPVTADPGLPGQAVPPAAGGDLAGKVPVVPGRKRQA